MENRIISMLNNSYATNVFRRGADFYRFDYDRFISEFGITTMETKFAVVYDLLAPNIKPQQRCILKDTLNDAYDKLRELKRCDWYCNIFIVRVN